MAFMPPDVVAPLLERLPRGLYTHVARVVAEVDRLAPVHGVDYDRAIFAAWAHDVARAMSDDDLLARARDSGIDVLDIEQEAPVLLHGPVGAEMLRRELKIDDEEVLNATRYHTTGRPGMSSFEMLILVADKVEPAKLTDEEIRRARAVATEDLKAAAKAFYRWHRRNNAGLGRATHPRALATEEWLGASPPS
jgi:predicted HD superfamily hydrolase involved in NAD metabolism